MVRGEVSFPNANMDDPVIARADGSVLYNFAVAVDDLDSRITHVVRGEDHISNTPKQLLVFEALGADPPRYAHLPLLHGPDGKKLSKRHGAASVQELRAGGYLPEAVNNYIALLGTGFAADEEFFTMDEMARRFRLDRVSKSPAVFDEQKLRHMNGQHLRSLAADELTERLERFTGRTGLRDAVEISREKIQTLADFWPLAGFLFDGPSDDPKAFAKVIAAGDGREISRRRARRWRRCSSSTWRTSSGRCADRRAPWGQAGTGVPTGSGRDRGDHDLTRNIRERGAARQGPHARADRPGPGRGLIRIRRERGAGLRG